MGGAELSGAAYRQQSSELLDLGVSAGPLLEQGELKLIREQLHTHWGWGRGCGNAIAVGVAVGVAETTL